ncbi:MAG: AI-2E family transporter [Actinomycetota bacterium]|nr:AI-2E family transporter [Actinomycetota bacterium]
MGALPSDQIPQKIRVEPPRAGAVARTVLVVIGVVIGLYVVYLLRRPIGWIVLACFLAVAMSGPVGWLSRKMRRGFAIAVAYVLLLLAPILLGLIVVPPFVSGAQDLAKEAPSYAQQARDFADKNPTLRKLEKNYGVLTQLQNEARKLPKKVGTGAATTLSDIGVTLINSVFAGLTILILSIFLVADGGRWLRRWLQTHPQDRAQRLERTLNRMASAVGNYVAGALVQATVAGITTFIVLEILGVPFAAPLAVIIALFDLIPLVGATIGALVVGVVTLFSSFPTDTIVWAIWAVVYQQLENNVIQPQIQTRAVNLNPFVVLVAVLFGSTLFGVFGALLAIPIAASIQIAFIEWRSWREANRMSAAGIVEPGAA